MSWHNLLHSDSNINADDCLICACGKRYAATKHQPIRCSCGNKIGTSKPLPTTPNKFLHARGSVGFIAPCYLPIGGTETWHRSLLPRLRGVAGFVSLDPTMSSGDMDALGCVTDVGIEAAKHLAKKCGVLVVWNVGDRLQRIVDGASCKAISVSHGGPGESWNLTSLRAQAPWTDHMVTICEDSQADVPHGIASTIIPNAPDPNRIKPTQTLPKPARKLAISISRFSPEKRLNFLANLFRYHLPDWELWLIGAKQGIGGVTIEESDNVRVFPATQTPGDYYAVADLFVQATGNEGYGLSAAEALLAGLPVVSHPVGLFADKPELATIVEHGATEADWVHAICTAQIKSIDDLDNIDDWVDRWQSLIDSMLPEGYRKAAICRSNACGRYNATNDTCGIITATGRPGQVGYLISHPDTHCVADNPLF